MNDTAEWAKRCTIGCGKECKKGVAESVNRCAKEGAADFKHKSIEVPLAKINLPLKDHTENIVLLLGGSFNPIHINHTRMMNIAKDHLTRVGLHIIGGYILPTHDASLKKKLGVVDLTNEQRLKMCEIALEDSDWIDVYPCLILNDKNIGIGRAKRHLEEYLTTRLGTGRRYLISVMQVAGVDTRDIFKSRIKDTKVIFVQNRPSQNKQQDNLCKWMRSKKIQPFVNKNVFSVVDSECGLEICSTKVRALVNSVDYNSTDEQPEVQELKTLLDGKVWQFHLQEKLRYSVVEQPTENPQKDFVGPLTSIVDFDCKEIKMSDMVPLYENSDVIMLGKGRQANVVSMKWDDTPVAVKKVDLRRQRGRRIQSFYRELRALARIDHQNVVKVFGAGTNGACAFIVMEHAEPIKCIDFLKTKFPDLKNKLYPIQWILHWVDIAEGLQCMSEAGILHRDLTLDNLLVFFRSGTEDDADCSNVIFKISDFGVSATEEDKDKIVRGSLRHYSPEALEDKLNYTSAADVYSFGLLMYEFIHQDKVWGDLTADKVIAFVLKGVKPEFERLMYPEVVSVIYKCLNFDASKRPTFSECVGLLRNAYDSISNAS